MCMRVRGASAFCNTNAIRNRAHRLDFAQQTRGQQRLDKHELTDAERARLAAIKGSGASAPDQPPEPLRHLACDWDDL